MDLVVIVAIVLIMIVLTFSIALMFKNKKMNGGDKKTFINSLGELKKLLGNSELGNYVTKNTDPKIWANYTSQITMTTTKLTTEITKITANPIGLLTNVLASPECIKFLLRSAPKALVAKFNNAKLAFKYVKGKIKKDENAKLSTLSKEMIKPYIKIYIELIILVYKKDLYQPFISPILQLVYKFPLLTDNLRKAIQKLYSIYDCQSIKAILSKSIDTILYSEDKMKSIYALFSGLVSVIIANMENVIETFIDEVKRLIKNGGKAIEDNVANMLSDKINNSLNNLSIQTVLKDPKINKLLTSEISKLGDSAKLIGGSYDYDLLFYELF